MPTFSSSSAWVDTLPGTGAFVATLSAANRGDVTPNAVGPKCQGKCSPCDGSVNTYITFGPSMGGDMYKPTDIITPKRSEQVTKPKGSPSLPRRDDGRHCLILNSFVGQCSVWVPSPTETKVLFLSPGGTKREGLHQLLSPCASFCTKYITMWEDTRQLRQLLPLVRCFAPHFVPPGKYRDCFAS